MRVKVLWPGLLFCATAIAQIPQGIDLSAIKGALSGAGGLNLSGPSGVLPTSPSFLGNGQDLLDQQAKLAQNQRLDDEIKAMKAKEKGPRRFASDLFDERMGGFFSTDGGVSEDYVLGAGDQLYLNVTGAASFDFTVQVDGRGQVVVPKLGSAQVAGQTLGRARKTLQGLVNRNFAKTQLDVQVVQLREVRVAILGEVYKPGTYLVPSLASLVNVVSLSGGPTATGSFRDIRVVRGGKVVFHLDLYPLRAEGLGNPNFALQSGDVVFVPLALQQVILEGAFSRVVAQPPKDEGNQTTANDPIAQQRDALVREIKAVKDQLDGGVAPAPAPAATSPAGAALPDLKAAAQNGSAPGFQSVLASLGNPSQPPLMGGAAVAPPQPLDAKTRRTLENRLLVLNTSLSQLDTVKRGDHRISVDPVTQRPLSPVTDLDQPDWLRNWNDKGIAPVMGFELAPGETVSDAFQFAGGLEPEAGVGTLSIRRRDPSGSVNALNVPATSEAMGKIPMRKGDILSALPQREVKERIVQLEGWVRLPGTYERADGLRVGDLLKRDSQVLPTTYRARGEIIRTLPDNTTHYLAFDVDKALGGDPAHNLLLENRDRVELYDIEDFRLQKTLNVSGPVAFAGAFNYHEGMRVSDLIFRAGVPDKSADRLVAELAHTRDGKPSQVIRLDLAKLLSTDASSPVRLDDDAVNPRLEPYDLLSFFERPDYKIHRVVQLAGQVVRPGSYVLESDHETLSQVIQRAGGITPDAMANAGIYLRKLWESDDSLQAQSAELGLTPKDPTANGISEILARLKETKRQPTTGSLLTDPVLHDLKAGNFNRLVVNFRDALKGNRDADVEMMDGDQVIIPRQTDAAYVVGEAASPFAAYKVHPGMKVSEVLRLAGGPTRNADTWNIRLLRADGRIVDRGVNRQEIEPGDAILVPQKIRRDFTWQENLAALTPLALILNAVK